MGMGRASFFTASSDSLSRVGAELSVSAACVWPGSLGLFSGGGGDGGAGHGPQGLPPRDDLRAALRPLPAVSHAD